jgi:hypothetical protein
MINLLLIAEDPELGNTALQNERLREIEKLTSSPPLFCNRLQNSYSATPLPTFLNFRLVKVNFNFSQSELQIAPRLFADFLEKVKF